MYNKNTGLFLNFKISFRLFFVFYTILFILFSLLFFSFTVDDSYIVWRYGKNLVEYGVWNWNNTSEYVESYSSFLYAVLSIGPEWLNISSPLFFKATGFLLFLYLIWRLKTILPRFGFLVGIGLIVADWKVYVHMFSGLETFLFIILLFELNFILLSIINNEPFKEHILWILCVLLPLTRPEATLYSLFSFYILLKYKGKIESKAAFFSAVAISGLYFFWRYSFFDSILPNAVYLKSFREGSYTLIFGNLYSSFGYFAVLFFLCVIIREKGFYTISAAATAVFFIAYSHSSLMMNYADRFSFQLFFPVFLLSLKYLNRANMKILATVLAFSIVISYHNILDGIKNLIEYTPRVHNSYKPLADILQRNKTKGAELVLADAGIIPYHTDMICYDALGLATKEIALKGLSSDYLNDIQPEYIIINSATEDETGVYFYNEQRLLLIFAKNKSYVPTKGIKFSDNSYLILYCRKDAKNLSKIKSEVNAIINNQRQINLKKILMMEYVFEI